MLLSNILLAQNSFKAIIKSEKENSPLTGATVTIKAINKTAISDSIGLVTINNIPSGKQILIVSYIGYKEQEQEFEFPLKSNEGITIFLDENDEEEEEVIITATRMSRTIKNLPTRVETISGEELSEKGNMKPGDIRMLLNESTGIQTQQTSATSYNSSIRIQGLDGRYTQIIRDGFPLYSGFSGGLSLMQVAPLDLKQIEVIKGSSSTLYGGGAIAGLVNLVSKTPVAKRELSFLTNGTSAGGLDLSGFYSQKFKKTGITVFGSRNSAKPYDPAGIGFTAIPKFERYSINPRLFIYGNAITANIGFSYISENRIGGWMDYLKHETPGYYEKNKTKRFTTQGELSYSINEKSGLNFKNSYTRFNRFIQIPNYSFEGIQQSTFSELTFSSRQKKKQWIIGLNLLTDDFAEQKQSTNTLRNYHYNTLGIFIQNTWSVAPDFSLETGLRGDYVKQFGFELLPRVSAMYRFTNHFTTRFGAGFGYKTPSVFNEESERVQFQNILPINQSTAYNERSAGVNFDVNYSTKIGNAGININQLFFYTKLNQPLLLVPSGTNYQFINADSRIDTRGWETNLRFSYSDFKLFVGYTYADVGNHFNSSRSWLPLTARHRLNNVLMYEQEGKLKIGLEAYYFSKQKLNDGSIGRSYWTAGLMGEKTWKHFSIFINLENFTDTRQTKFDSIYTGTVTNPVFRDIYAPVDGFVVNGGIKVRL